MDHAVSCHIQPIRYDLYPFAGLLDDGRPHRAEGSIVGVPEGQSGWSTPVNVLVRQDGKSAHVTGALTEVRAGDLATPSTRTPGTERRLDTEGSHRRTVAGFVDTSHGRVTTTVRRSRRHLRAHLVLRREPRRARREVERRRDGHRRGVRPGPHHPHPAVVHEGRNDDARRGRPAADGPHARRPGDGRRARTALGAPRGPGWTTPTRVMPRTRPSYRVTDGMPPPRPVSASPARGGRLLRPSAGLGAGSADAGPDDLLTPQACEVTSVR